MFTDHTGKPIHPLALLGGQIVFQDGKALRIRAVIGGPNNLKRVKRQPARRGRKGWKLEEGGA